MTFSVVSSDLMSRLSAVGRVVSKKNAMPILDNFLFRICSDCLMVTASDGDTTVTAKVPITDVDGEGRVVVPVSTIMDPLKELSQQVLTITIDPKDYNVKVDYFFGAFEFMGGSADEYPVARGVDDAHSVVTMPAQSLLRGIRNTVFATADDELRPVMNGILFDVCDNVVTFVASDSKKLVRCRTCNGISGSNGTMIIPKKPASIISNVIDKMTDNINIMFDASRAFCLVGDYEIIFRQIEGKYPRYEAVIPKSNKNILQVDRQLMLSALKRVHAFSDKATGLVRFDLSEGKMALSSQDIDYSVAGNETVQCTYTASPLAIGFRATQVIEVLNVLSSKEVSIALGTSTQPGICTPVTQTNGEDLLILVTPMQLV